MAWRFSPEISAVDRTALIAAGAADVRHVERRFARRFATPPEVHVLPSEASLAQKLTELYEVEPARAVDLAHRYSGYTSDNPRSHTSVVVLDWARIGVERPIHRLRHEITHVMVHQIVPQTVPVPAWFNEGLAELEAHSVPGLTWPQLQSRHFAASMAATGTLMPLDRVSSYEQTLAILGEQLANGTESVRLLEADVTRPRVLGILEELARGKRFEQAFSTATGLSFARFAASVEPRLRALAPSYPGIAATPDDPSGPGLTYVLYGFRPRSRVTVRIKGAGLTGVNSYVVSEHGYLSQYLMAGWPAGRYDIEATGEGESARVTAIKR
ncbi:Hypothetical protein A7982_11043 [Minicystis rosea]|nr:Hypothetical protein A7982_11043 [Minicystis rosea]